MVMAQRKSGVKQIGNYKLNGTLGKGNFAKVKQAINVRTEQSFAVKILNKEQVLRDSSEKQIKQEIFSMKMIRHPHVVRLYEVLATRKKIFIVLEQVDGGELLQQIIKHGRLPESVARRYFQQIIDAVGHCHNHGVYHRDLKLDNILLDEKDNVKISDFGLSALPAHCRADGLLHTTCGSPNYVAPEVLANRGYEGAPADIWSCGVILFVLLTACFPFHDPSLAILYQKVSSADYTCPERLSEGAKNLIARILDPNPLTRATVAEITKDPWFRQGYSPEEKFTEENTDVLDDETEDQFGTSEEEEEKKNPICVNAFDLIALSRSLDLSGFFEEEDVAERKTRFISVLPSIEILRNIEEAVKPLGFRILKKVSKGREIKMFQSDGIVNLWITVEVLMLKPCLHVVEIRRGGSNRDTRPYKQVCARLSNLSSELHGPESVTCSF